MRKAYLLPAAGHEGPWGPLAGGACKQTDIWRTGSPGRSLGQLAIGVDTVMTENALTCVNCSSQLRQLLKCRCPMNQIVYNAKHSQKQQNSLYLAIRVYILSTGSDYTCNYGL